MCNKEGRVKSYNPSQGNHIGYTTHEVEAGEVVSIVRKYGNMPQNQAEIMSFVTQSKENNTNDLTVSELKKQLDEKGVEYKANATKKEDRKSTRLNSSHVAISYAVFCLKK